MFKMIRTMRGLASRIAALEGKKSQAHIGDIREILAILSDLIFKDPRYMLLLFYNGLKRAKKLRRI